MFEKMSGTRIAQIFCGKDRFDVVDAKAPKCFLNGIDVIGAKAGGLERFSSIVGMLVTSACVAPKTEVVVKRNPSFSDFLSGLVDTLTKSDQVKVNVLEMKPDENSDNTPKEASFDIRSLDEFREGLKTYANCFDDTVNLSGVLLKTKLPRSITGFKELHRILSDTKTASEELSTKREQYEIASEQLDNRISQIIIAVVNNLDGPKRANILKTAVAKVLDNFFTVKRLSAETFSSFNPLYNVDKAFKKYTEYPATWYFEPSVFYNFTEKYKDASDHMIDLARAEASIIRPLHFWKIKVTGE